MDIRYRICKREAWQEDRPRYRIGCGSLYHRLRTRCKAHLARLILALTKTENSTKIYANFLLTFHTEWQYDCGESTNWIFETPPTIRNSTMYYGHSSNCGHGRRTPVYEWDPSFYPSRRRKRRRSSPTGFSKLRKSGASSPRCKSLETDYLRYPKLSLVPSSLGEGLVQIIGGSVLAAIWMYWEFFLAAGIAAFVLRFLARQCRKSEKTYIINCEREYNEIRINRKISVNSPPMAETFLAAWKATRGVRRGDPDALAARLRLGSMLSDLEPVVDQSYIRDERGTIVGRRPGLRGWIAWNCPELLPHYKALMAYKVLADKLRVALKIQEPDTLDSVLELGVLQTKISVDSGNPVDAGKEGAGVENGVQASAGKDKGQDVVDNSRRTGKKNGKGRGEEREKQGVWKPKSMQIKCNCKLLKTNVNEVRNAYGEIFRSGVPVTMAGLEVAVREKLGLAWMRRGRRIQYVA